MEPNLTLLLPFVAEPYQLGLGGFEVEEQVSRTSITVAWDKRSHIVQTFVRTHGMVLESNVMIMS